MSQKTKRIRELIKQKKSNREITAIIKEEFPKGVSFSTLKEIRNEETDTKPIQIDTKNDTNDTNDTNKVPKTPKKPKTPKIVVLNIDLRDILDEFLIWIGTLDPNKFKSTRKSVIDRIKNHKRPAFIEGTVILLNEFFKTKGYMTRSVDIK
jgi:hypothetical protein